MSSDVILGLTIRLLRSMLVGQWLLVVLVAPRENLPWLVAAVVLGRLLVLGRRMGEPTPVAVKVRPWSLNLPAPRALEPSA